MDRSRKIRINGAIRGTPRVQVIGGDGRMLGEMSLAEALRLALAKGLDLVEVNPSAAPPVCKLLDFDRYKYEARKRLAEREPDSEGGGDED